jgi:hypothetical protein
MTTNEQELQPTEAEYRREEGWDYPDPATETQYALDDEAEEEYPGLGWFINGEHVNGVD